MSIDFMMWKDEYETLRRKYDYAIGRMERGAEKLRQMARVADQFSVQARTLRQGVIPTRDTNRELSNFLGIIGQYLGCSPPQHPYWTRRKTQIMDEQTNDQVQAVHQDVEEDMPAHPLDFTPQRSSSPCMVDRTYPTSFPAPNSNTTTQQAAHESNPISTPIMEGGKKISEEQGSRRRLEFLKERLRVIEGADMYGSVDTTQLCLISDVVIPSKFKTPDFEKYNGTTCPKSHLVMYCRKMSAYAHNDKLLIHYFQDSLVGLTSRWYMQLDGSQVHRWKDLADSFLKQYKYNIDMVPDRLDLQRIEKKNVETFKEYAQRWRELAAQVQPPITDKELTRIEFGVKNGRISDPASETRRMMTPKKTEGEVHELSSTQRVATRVSSPMVGQTNFSPGYQNGGQSPFELLPQPLKSHQVAIVPQEPLQPPYPKYWLKFKKTGEEPDVNQNPLPNHEGPAINAIDTFTQRHKNRREDWCTNKEQCLFHPETNDHSIEDCCPFAYKDNHVVPWKYECQFITDNVVSATIGEITHSGRCYTPDNLKDVSKEDEVRRRKGKAIEMADEEIPPEGTGHTKALYISVKCKDHHVARVLVDNGSSLNIMSRSTLMKLHIDPPYLRPSIMVVRAFDDARREVIGDIDIPLKIGPSTFNVSIQVIDVNSSYSCLLGRPWIHSAGTVPSLLHQRLKFSVEGGQAIVYGEDNMFVTKTSTLPYVEATEEALECSYRSFEIANATIFPIEGLSMDRYVSKTSLMIGKTMIKSCFQMHKGLGKDNQRDSKVISLPKAKEKFGLGYKPAASEWEKRKRRNEDSEISIAVVSENTSLSHPLVHQCLPGFELNNWEIKKTLEVTKGSQKSTRVEGDVDDIVDFKVPICNLEQNIEVGESDISPELLRLIEQEEKKTMLYQETLKVINLGTLKEVKEVRIGTLASEQYQSKLVTLLHEFKDIFAWSY
ncbi:uncharacterized protein E5676_scaffold70G00280 [Cucumis melo var. makuwa]|uniref:Retrotransposon gag domain-containing protein n=1 Tax=Cucumis melo var. makuwa TaxID=1194695 RepID=A0A5D3C587_CUCMM|nr:uncharacterized protein E5676_scaffold70G00280 [Cucumis melo var. makuwa]